MYRIYQIGEETMLSEIANKFNTNEEQLKIINGIDNNYVVKRGNYIIVPFSNINENENFDIYKVRSGDTIYKVAQNYNVDYKQLLDLNGLDKDEYIYANQEILVPKQDVLFKITKENETLNTLATKWQITIDDIIKQNATIYLKPEQLIVYKKENK